MLYDPFEYLKRGSIRGLHLHLGISLSLSMGLVYLQVKKKKKMIYNVGKNMDILTYLIIQLQISDKQIVFIIKKKYFHYHGYHTQMN